MTALHQSEHSQVIMPNIGIALKQEIVRLSRKETKGQVAGARKAAAQQRKDIAALKQRVTTLEKQLAALAKRTLPGNGAKAAAAAVPEAGENGTKGARFSAKGLRALRERKGLSQADFGRLLGVSGQSVYNWESGSSRPKPEQIAKFAAVRALGKKELAERLG